MNTLTVIGRFKRLDIREKQSKAGKAYTDSKIIVESQEPIYDPETKTSHQGPALIPLKPWGKVLDKAKTIAPGSLVEVRGVLKSNQWEDNISAVPMATDIMVLEGASTASREPGEDDDRLAF
ncbi:MAG TPA: single-stranded DNA-binding protein [Salinarimonas sp.]|nr:single-stranded DNA-binding protein [Salinarimonas sp.]